MERDADTAGRFDWTAPWLVAGMAFVIYVRTLLPSVAFGDWGEMQTVPHILGIAHPTGYPTYVMLAWLVELAPIGSVAFRANLLSAVFVAGALATFTLICLRLGVRPVLAIAAGLILGVVGTVWAARDPGTAVDPRPAGLRRPDRAPRLPVYPDRSELLATARL